MTVRILDGQVFDAANVPDTYTLAENDEIAISISGVGTLKNVVVTV